MREEERLDRVAKKITEIANYIHKNIKRGKPYRPLVVTLVSFADQKGNRGI